MKSTLFVRLDVNYLDDERILDVSVEAEAVFIRSIALAKRRASDGRIARAHLRMLTDRCVGHPDGIADELVAAGLWEPCEGGWYLPSFLKHNPSAADIEEQRQAEAKRKADARKRPKGTTPDATNRPPGHEPASGNVRPDKSGRDVVSATTEAEAEAEAEAETDAEAAAEPEAGVRTDHDRTLELLLQRRRAQQDATGKPITNHAAWTRSVRAGLETEHGDRIDADLALGLSPDTIAASIIPLPTDRIPAHATRITKLEDRIW